MKWSSKKVRFENHEGSHLDGRLDHPKGKVHAYAVFAHCFTCSKNVLAATRISRSLAEKGYGVLRFDFTGLGESGGDFSDSNFSSNIQDLHSAAHFLAAEYEAPQLLIGHSLGGLAVLVAASKMANIKAVVTIGAPATTSHLLESFKANIADIQRRGHAVVNLAGRSFKIKKHFIYDLENQDALHAIESLKSALLIFHSPQDNTVGIDNAADIFRRARHPKSFISLDQADHLLTNKVDSDYVAETLAAWVKRYL